MRRKTDLRRYLLAALCNEETPQTPDCKCGPIWDNCNGPAQVLDSFTGQIDEDAECLKSEEISIVFRVSARNYQMNSSEICRADMTAEIDIIACHSSDAKRQDILDEVESRILHRLLSGCVYTDAQTEEKLKPMFGMADQNLVTADSDDESDFDGKQTVRTLSFAFTTNPCVKRSCCEAPPICFDFSQLSGPSCG